MHRLPKLGIKLLITFDLARLVFMASPMRYSQEDRKFSL
jgi:hypothetical protein